MRLIVVIPALNEAATIGDVIRRIPRTIDGISDVRVVVVDDGSTDDTARISEAAGASVVRHHNNRGVGVAFKSGVEYALAHQADILVNMDGDGQFNPEDIPKLVGPIVNDAADFVTASRFATPEVFPQGIPPLKLFGNRTYAKMISNIIGKRFTDVSCGFRAYQRETLLKMTLFGAFTYTQETFLDLAGKRLRLVEIPIKVRGVREHGKSRLASNLFRFGFKTLSIMLRSMRDLAPFRFFGLPGFLLASAGLLIEAILFIYWLFTRHTSPFQSLIFVGGFLLVVGAILGLVALIADMLHRQRIILEENLYYNRKRYYAQSGPGSDRANAHVQD
jgi:glycosyltransferase involved in cell wall biosynthesis